MDQRLRLLSHRFRNDRVGMPEDVDRHTADKVEVLVALGVPDACAFSTLEDDGLAPIVLEKVLLFVGNPVGHFVLLWR